MDVDSGVIDPANNPFGRRDWIEGRSQLTRHRRDQVEPLLGMTVDEIRQKQSNFGKYPAFVAIRWRFAEIKDGRLTQTAKWDEWRPPEVSLPHGAQAAPHGVAQVPVDQADRLPAKVVPPEHITRANLLCILQDNIAERCVGISAVRGQPAGTLQACRAFFRSVELDGMPRSDAAAFTGWLDQQTDHLKSTLPAAQKPWGIARKTINLFLRDAVYNKRLHDTYQMGGVQSLLEVPLDSVVACRLRKRRGLQKLPRWPGLTRLGSDTHRLYQEAALRVAENCQVDRVDLDLVYWTEGRRTAEEKAR